MKRIIYLLSLFCLASCHMKQPAVPPASSIDSTLQTKVADILQQQLDTIQAECGQVIVMECGTGYIKAMVALQKKDSNFIDAPQLLVQQQYAPLMSFVSLATILGEDSIALKDTIDVGNGIYFYKEQEIRDHNHHRGGYGELTLKDGVSVRSNISIIKAVDQVYGNHPMGYFEKLQAIDYLALDSVKGLPGLQPISIITPNSPNWIDADLGYVVLGYEQQTTSIQTLSFFNIIANHGRYVTPRLTMEESSTINQSVFNTLMVEELQGMLRYCITDGLDKKANTEYTQVAGYGGTSNLRDNLYSLAFCGYYPAATPQYIIIVSINKEGLPASAIFASAVFREIVEYMVGSF